MFANKKILLKSYNIGDKFVMTISATCQTDLNINIDEENTLTHLSIRITEKDYSFIMPINKDLQKEDIVFNYLNPLRTNYIPRVLETDGVKLSIQDLIALKVSPPNDFSSEEKEPKKRFDLIFQVDNKMDHNQVNLDLFVNLWKNYSASNIFLNEFSDLVEREPQDARRVLDQSLDGFDSRPFYFNWLFWLLCIIGILLVIILIFFFCCIKLTRKQSKKSKKTGIVIEYPRGLNPTYQDGVINFNQEDQQAVSKPARRSNNQKSSRSKIVPVHLEQNIPCAFKEYEDQELEMFVDDDSYANPAAKMIQQHHENK